MEVLQNAQIALRNTGTDETRTAITDQGGSYRFSLLPPGEYEADSERRSGFAPLTVREVLIRITEVRSLTTQLAVEGVPAGRCRRGAAPANRQRRTRQSDCSRND